tara:strand:- start:449 stop:778 length:330 start_codon:yes stop_codon:yes gene_type:complete
MTRAPLLKQSLIYLTLSVLIILFAEYAKVMVVYLDLFYTYINLKLAPVFSNSGMGILIRKVVSLIIIPVGIAAIPAFIYRLVKGSNMPYFIQVTWLLWLIIVLSKVLIQ